MKIRGTPFTATIIEIIDKFEDVVWKGDSPCICFIKLDGGELRFALLRELKGTRKK